MNSVKKKFDYIWYVNVQTCSDKFNPDKKNYNFFAKFNSVMKNFNPGTKKIDVVKKSFSLRKNSIFVVKFNLVE